jgi:hypothetical protein
MHHSRLMAALGLALLLGGMAVFARGGAVTLTGQEPGLAERVQQLEERMAAVEARLAALEAQLAPVPPATAATPGPAQPDVLLDLTGTTSRRTDTFAVTGSGIEVCWEITRSEASGTTPPRVSYSLYRTGERNSLTSIDSNQRGAMACETIQLAQGDYYFEVTMVFPGRWRLTVKPLP